MTRCVVEIERLSYRYPDGSPALNEVSLEIREGERVALVGANGAGKSTLLLHLNGTLPSSSVRVCGLPATGANLKTIRQKVGLVFQDPDDQLFCPTVFEDVAFGPRNLGLAADDVRLRVEEALRSVGLQGFQERSAFHLSVGQKKRAALATVLAMRPEIVVLDEPSSNLDPRVRRELIGLLKALPGTLIVATHDFGLARQLCPRAVVLSKGKIAGDGETESLLTDSAFLARHDLD
jgi:cobalt/nickel transport system ATP-binding protein